MTDIVLVQSVDAGSQWGGQVSSLYTVLVFWTQQGETEKCFRWVLYADFALKALGNGCFGRVGVEVWGGRKIRKNLPKQLVSFNSYSRCIAPKKMTGKQFLDPISVLHRIQSKHPNNISSKVIYQSCPCQYKPYPGLLFHHIIRCSFQSSHCRRKSVCRSMKRRQELSLWITSTGKCR